MSVQANAKQLLAERLRAERAPAPFGRRRAEVAGNRASGGYRVFSLLDPSGPEPAAGQFYMLAAASRWDSDGERPYLPRAFSVAEAAAEAEPGDRLRLDFLVDDVGPGTERLTALEKGEDVWINGPLGNPFSAPADLVPSAAGAVLVGGGIGVAPLAIWRRRLSEAGVPTRVLLGFRDEAHSGGLELFGRSATPGREAEEVAGFAHTAPAMRPAEEAVCASLKLASEDGHAGHRGYVTDLLAVLLEGDEAGNAPVYACGPPAMLEAVRIMCAERDVTCELAIESPMACGFGACFGCAVPIAGGGYMRLCVDGPVVRGDLVETALVAGAGHR